MSRKRRSRGKTLIIIGMLLVMAAGVLYYANLSEDKSAGEASTALLCEMDSGNVEEGKLCGKLTISALELTLPVLAEWSEYGLTQAPCRYSGNAEDGDMIIAAHNYSSHFGRLKELSQGDVIVFSDLYGQVYEYCVKEMSTLDGTAVSDMKSGEWDLTLFTCTKGGKQRVTIRCEALNSLQ